MSIRDSSMERRADGVEMSSFSLIPGTNLAGHAKLTNWHFVAWSMERKIELVHIQPGKPTERTRGELLRKTARSVFAGRLVSELV